MIGTIDFLRPHPMSMIGWLLLMAGAVLLGGAVWIDGRWAAERSAVEAASRARWEAQRREQAAAARPPVLSDEEQRLLSIAPQLRQPWLRSLRIVENASAAPVYLLHLAVDPASGAFRLDAEAPTFEDAVDYVGRLDEEGVLGPAELRSHELGTDSAGRVSVRFAVQTRWSMR
jgi:hypothetical protein